VTKGEGEIGEERERIERDSCSLDNVKETKSNQETNRNILCEIE
jgi:hypothetical protein